MAPIQGCGVSMASFLLYFDGQFWVGLITASLCDGAPAVGRVVFGPEPSDAQLLDWMKREYPTVPLLPTDANTDAPAPKGNPKRRLREARRALQSPATGTASQLALKTALEAKRMEVDQEKRDEKDAEARRRYELRVQKRKQRHRGK